MDEALELANCFLAQFPQARMLEGFVNQGLFVGLAIKSKRLVQSLYTYYSDELLSAKIVRTGYSPSSL